VHIIASFLAGRRKDVGRGFGKGIGGGCTLGGGVFEAEEPALLDLRITGKDCCSCPHVRGLKQASGTASRTLADLEVGAR
jgi:hypothetical protein